MQTQIDLTPDEGVLNEAEQEALKVGEELHQEEQRMLAGKFEDAEALEKAYLELQQKLGGNNGDEEQGLQDNQDNEEGNNEEEVEVSPAVELISNASQQFAETGQLSDEVREQFNSMSSQDLVDAYMSMQGNLPAAPQQAEDISEGDINFIKNSVGGEQGYAQLMEWAGEALDETYVDAFNQLTELGSPAAIQLAVAGLKAQYEQDNGYEGRMLTGGDSKASSADVFRSQAEVVAAMNDPRYDRDPAYRNDIFEKLDRSNIDF